MPLREALQQEQCDLRRRDEEEARQVADRIQEIVDMLMGTEHEKTYQQVADFLLTGWPLNPILQHPVSALELNIRVQNIFEWANIHYIGDLVQKTEEELGGTYGFGPVNIKNIKWVLGEMHLSLGTKIDTWPPVGLSYD